MNLLCKGSLRHLTEQLRRTPEQHAADIAEEVRQANEAGVTVNLYLEDWSNGINDSPDYVFALVDALRHLPIRRFMLPDTLGVLNPETTFEFCRRMTERYPELHFDFHAHNDYGLAVANTYMAIRAGVRGVHVTINGLGERAGNATFSSTVAVIHDQLHYRTAIREAGIYRVSKSVETYSGIHISPNQPIAGENVFTQCAGVHADGDAKNNLYCNPLVPERFGRTREYALGKTSGKANIRKNLEALGIELDDETMNKVTERVVELGDKKELLTQEDLPYIVSDVLRHNIHGNRIRILNYSLSLTHGLRPVATIKIEIDGRVYEETATGDGQYDAFVAALQKIYKSLGRTLPMLTNYAVTIPPRRPHRCICSDHHHVESQRHRVQDPWPRCRPNRSRHQGYSQNAEQNRVLIQPVQRGGWLSEDVSKNAVRKTRRRSDQTNMQIGLREEIYLEMLRR